MEHDIKFELILNTDTETVWKKWTTREGMMSFFAPEAAVDLEIGGRYELYFDPQAPAGEKGAEGMKILAIEDKKLLSFTWNAPTTYPEIRRQRTCVCIRIEKPGEGKTRLVLENTGYGYSREWQEALEYFRIAWGNVVLPRLKYSIEDGPVDWNDRKSLEKYYLYHKYP